MISIRRVGLVAIVALAAACSVSAPARVEPDAPEASGAGEVEAARPGAPAEGTGAEGGAPADEAPTPGDEAPTPGEILGTLTGSCGVVRTQLSTSTSTFEKNALSFTAEEAYEAASLSPEGQRIMTTPNAGGSSIESEVMSFEVLRACEGARLLKTETEIAYGEDTTGPKTDLLVEIDGAKIGVSVTRAYRPTSIPFPDADVKKLIQDKLEDVQESSARVTPADKWKKQILHVFASSAAQAEAVTRVLPTIDAAVRADTIVLLTQTSGGGFVYCNPDPPLGSECP